MTCGDFYQYQFPQKRAALPARAQSLAVEGRPTCEKVRCNFYGKCDMIPASEAGSVDSSFSFQPLCLKRGTYGWLSYRLHITYIAFEAYVVAS